MSAPTPRRVIRRALSTLAAAAAVALAALVAAPAASADRPFGHPMPGGSWTFVRGDAYLHYACKVPMSGAYGPVYKVRTLSWHNGSWTGPGVWVVTTRGGNSAIVDQRTQKGWLYGFAGTEVWASAWYADRLWIQGAYYGPSRPWTDGYPVRNLRTC